jgi:hypothetical protein
MAATSKLPHPILYAIHGLIFKYVHPNATSSLCFMTITTTTTTTSTREYNSLFYP